MAKKMPKRTTMTRDTYGIANEQGEPWTAQTWDKPGEAELYISAWSQMNKIPLPKHRVVPVRVTVRFTSKTRESLKAKR